MVVFLISAVLLSFSIQPTFFAAAQEGGPRTEDLSISYFSSMEAAYAALEAGDIDLMDGGLAWSDGLFPAGMMDTGGLITEVQYLDAITNPNIVLGPVDAMNMYQFDLNNNWSIQAYPGIRSPTSYQGFRQALARLTDKDFMVYELCGETQTPARSRPLPPRPEGAPRGFDLMWARWDENDIPVEYFVHSDVGPQMGALVQQAFQAWADVQGSSMDYTFMGTIGGDPPDSDNPVADGVNVVYWAPFDPWNELCFSVVWVDQWDTIVEFDIVLNAGADWFNADVQTVCMHEVGHTLGLQDLVEPVDNMELMFWARPPNPGERFRNLGAGDKAGIRYIYGNLSLAERIDQPIPASLWAWTNDSFWYANYPWAYNPLFASFLLDDAGFSPGVRPNPFFHPTFPGSSEYIRTYPQGHSLAGQDLDPLEFVVRVDDTRLWAAGQLLIENMRRHGIPVNVIAADAEIARARVFDDHNYHIYTGAWTTWKLPTHNHFLYHTNYNRALGSNYVHGFENDGVTPNHPALNDFLNQIYYSETLDGAWTATQQAMGRFVDLVVTIPLWSDRSYAAWSSDLLGIVNMDGYGPINPYTFMNARKFDGSPIRIGAVAEPDAMNIIFSTGISDYVNLDRMNMYGVFETPPYSLAVDQPGWVQNWEVNTWFDGGDGEVKTMVRKSFRDDASFVEPETGGQTMDVDASNYFFSAWYEFAVTDSWHYSSWQDVHHINVVDDFTVEIFFDDLSCWFANAASGPLLPMDTWLQPPLATSTTEIFVEGTTVTTPGPVNLGSQPVWIESITADDIPLTMFVDFNIVEGQLEIFQDLVDSTVVSVDYWFSGNPAGETPGNLPWQIIFEGAGMYFPTAFTPGGGGSLTLRRNPSYWMETPSLGDVDFLRGFDGAYSIDIFDLVRAAQAFGTEGIGEPDVRWLPGADLAFEGGVVNIFDIVTMAVRFGERWDRPP